MSERIRYTNEPLGDLEVIPDFLPSPEDLVFRDAQGTLLAVSVVDREPKSLSAVYCYYDPSESARRSLGIFNILTLVQEARRRGFDFVYLGYWLGDSRKMNYKAAFQPSEVWSPVAGFSSTPMDPDGD